MSILGFFRSALAIASLCFCPPDKLTTELVPMNVSSLSSKPKTNYALAWIRAFSISASVASLFPNWRFSLIVPIIRVGS
jgi:hypothetical protein